MQYLLCIMCAFFLFIPSTATSAVERTPNGKDPQVVQNYYKAVNHILTGNFKELTLLLDSMEDSRQLTINGRKRLALFYDELLAMDSDLVDRWCKNTPESAHPFIVRAMQTIQKEDDAQALQSARADLEQAWKIAPENPASSSSMITLCTLTGCAEKEVEQWFQRATSADPSWVSAYMNKLLYLSPDAFGSEKQMEDFAVYCAENSPEGSTVYSVLPAYFLLLNTHHYPPYPFETYALRLPKKAHELLIPAIQKYKADFAHSVVPLYYEGIYTFLRGKRTASEFILSSIIDLEPDNLDALKALVTVEMSGDKWEKARKYLAKILQLEPESPFGLTNMGAIHTLLLNDRRKTVELYNRAIELEQSEALKKLYKKDLDNLLQYSGS